MVIPGPGQGRLPHISYYDTANSDLNYAFRDSTGWHIQAVDSAGDVGEQPSLALDGAGYPHISYYDATNADLKYAFQNAAGWHIFTVNRAGEVGQSSSLALDGDGIPHISYIDKVYGDLLYTRMVVWTNFLYLPINTRR